MSRDISEQKKIQAYARGRRSNQITVQRPTWAGMLRDYPIEPSGNFYLKISKNWYDLANHKDEKIRLNWENTCAVRMAYALNRNGMILAKGKAVVMPDNPKDKYQYWLKVQDLIPELKKRLGKPNGERNIGVLADVNTVSMSERRNYVQTNIINKIKGRKGIIVFEVSGWTNATGHFTLWDGEKLLYAPEHDNPHSDNYYFWYPQTENIIFWELI